MQMRALFGKRLCGLTKSRSYLGEDAIYLGTTGINRNSAMDFELFTVFIVGLCGNGANCADVFHQSELQNEQVQKTL